VYRRRANEITSLLEQPIIHLTAEEATQMVENDENRPLKDFAAPKSIGIQLGYTVHNVAANNFELKLTLLNIVRPFFRALRTASGDGMRKKDTEIPPNRAFV
jgi:hypothetical protein